jgi:hypothetical protein
MQEENEERRERCASEITSVRAGCNDLVKECVDYAGSIDAKGRLPDGSKYVNREGFQGPLVEGRAVRTIFFRGAELA